MARLRPHVTPHAAVYCEYHLITTFGGFGELPLIPLSFLSELSADHRCVCAWVAGLVSYLGISA